ncbi:hypothetical protein PQR11_15855 [Paraburkholderia strydomiana]|uniref:hypothetical protein n=1 Tax=Paraburkholderia strydomiana TaxID=1245417 RepID=UPI0038BA05B7
MMKTEGENEKRAASTHADSEGASADCTSPIVEHLAIKGVAKRCAGGTARRAGYEASEDRACNAATHGADRTAECTNGSAGFCA